LYDQLIPYEWLINKINQTFHTYYSSKLFTEEFSYMIEQTNKRVITEWIRNTFEIYEPSVILCSLKGTPQNIEIDTDEEEQFIKNTINVGEYTYVEYISIHNEKFGTSYVKSTFKEKFSHIFSEIQRSVQNIKTPVIILRDIDRISIYKEYLKSLFTVCDKYPKELLINTFNKHFHTYYSIKTFEIEFNEFLLFTKKFTLPQYIRDTLSIDTLKCTVVTLK